MVEQLLSAIAVAIAALAGGGVVKLLDWLALQRDRRRMEKLQDREGMVKEYSTFLGELRGEVHQLRGQIQELNLKHENCLRREAVLSTEVRQLQIRVAELSTGGGEAMVITDDMGVIMGWSREATTLFGWSALEALGKNVAELIVPEEYRELHNAAIERWRSQSRPPRGQALIFQGQNKHGEKFPIDISLTGFQAGERWDLTATIRRRSDRFD